MRHVNDFQINGFLLKVKKEGAVVSKHESSDKRKNYFAVSSSKPLCTHNNTRKNHAWIGRWMNACKLFF